MEAMTKKRPQGMKKVLCPVERSGKTYWIRLGAAFVNDNGSITVNLDCLPVNGKLMLFEWEDRREERAEQHKPPLHAVPAAAEAHSNEELPF